MYGNEEFREGNKETVKQRSEKRKNSERNTARKRCNVINFILIIYILDLITLE